MDEIEKLEDLSTQIEYLIITVHINIARTRNDKFSLIPVDCILWPCDRGFYVSTLIVIVTVVLFFSFWVTMTRATLCLTFWGYLHETTRAAAVSHRDDYLISYRLYMSRAARRNGSHFSSSSTTPSSI